MDKQARVVRCRKEEEEGKQQMDGERVGGSAQNKANQTSRSGRGRVKMKGWGLRQGAVWKGKARHVGFWSRGGRLLTLKAGLEGSEYLHRKDAP